MSPCLRPHPGTARSARGRVATTRNRGIRAPVTRKPYDLSAEEIRAELLSDHNSVRERFLEHFGAEIEVLAVRLYEAYSRLGEFNRKVRTDHRAAWVQMFLYSALNNVLTAGQLLTVGMLQPAGNLMRAFGELVAMALLISLPETGVFERIEADDKYSVKNAVDTVSRRKNLERLGIDARDWRRFKRSTNWYAGYSHASLFALASLRNFSQPSALTLGSDFDDAKIDAYRKLLSSYISAADQLPIIIAGAERKILEVHGKN